MHRARALFLVCAGGALGGLLRVLALALPLGWSDAVGLLTVNVFGAFMLGIVASSIRRPSLHLFLGAGLLGGFTSYSAMIALSQPGDGFWLGLGIAALTLIAGTAVSGLGLKVGSARSAKRASTDAGASA